MAAHTTGCKVGAASVSDRRHRRCHRQGDGSLVCPGREFVELFPAYEISAAKLYALIALDICTSELQQRFLRQYLSMQFTETLLPSGSPTRNYSLPRRQWIGTEQLFEELDDLTLPRQILDNFFKRVPS